MLKFFSEILKHKRILIFAVFLFIFSFAGGAKIVNAACDTNWYDRSKSCECVKDKCIATTCAASLVASSTGIGTVVGLFTCRDKCVDDFDCNGTIGADTSCLKEFSTYNWLGAALADVISWPYKVLAQVATFITGKVIQLISDLHITNDMGGTDAGAKAFISGWKSTRDIANMLIVLGFVIVGIATALRIREYEAKKALWPLIIVALFVNFSGLLCGVIIDASNITTQGLIGSSLPKPGGGAQAAGKSPLGAMGGQIYNQVAVIQNTIQCKLAAAGTKDKTNQDTWGYIVADLTFIPLYILIALTFLFLCVVIAVRYALLGILFVLSPLAFAFYAFPFPKAKDLFNKWWAAYLKWAFIGVGMAFFLFLAMKILGSDLTIPNNIKDLNKVANVPDATGIFSRLFVVMMVIITGIYMSIKSSGAIGSAVMGIAGGVAGFAMGAIAGGAKIAGRGADAALKAATGGKASFSGAGRKISSGVGQAMEKIGLRGQGTTAKNAQASMKGVNERVNSMSEEDLTKAASSRAFTADGTAVKAAATLKLAKDGKINKLGNTDQQSAAVASAEDYFKGKGMGAGDVRSNAVKSNPLLARGSDAAVQAEMQKESTRLEGMGVAKDRIPQMLKSYKSTAQNLANAPVIAKAFQGANVGDIRKYGKDALESDAFRDNVPSGKVVKAAQEMSGEQIQSIETHIPTLATQTLAAAMSGNVAAHAAANKKLTDYTDISK